MGNDNKEKFIINLVMFAMFGLITEVIFTGLTGSLSNTNDYHYMTLMGHVSLWMAFVYIFAFPILNKLNDIQNYYELPMIIQTIVGGIVIGTIELLFGILFNIILGLNCWYYDGIHILHQVCLQNFLAFMASYPLAIYLIDKTEWILYRRKEDEELLNYGVLDNYKDLFKLK